MRPNEGMKLSQPEYLGGSWSLRPVVIEAGFAAYAQCSADTSGLAGITGWIQMRTAVMTGLLALGLVSPAVAEENPVAAQQWGCRWSEQWRTLSVQAGEPNTTAQPKRPAEPEISLPRDRKRRAGKGLPIVEAVVDKTGHVVDARIMLRPKWATDWPELDEAVLKAVRKWKFEEAAGGPEAAPACLTMAINIHWR